ncbi:Uncharacterised protein g10991 [Pycnogonum litorale]
MFNFALICVIVTTASCSSYYDEPYDDYRYGTSYRYGRRAYDGYGYGATAVDNVVAKPNKPATPYEMGYDIVDEYGNANSRRESGDTAGNKFGSYSIALADGRKRIVEYKADHRGFRAIVKSNEPGTDQSQDAADVDNQSLDGYSVKKPKTVVAPAPSYAYGSSYGNKHAGGYKAGPVYGLRRGGYGSSSRSYVSKTPKYGVDYAATDYGNVHGRVLPPPPSPIFVTDSGYKRNRYEYKDGAGYSRSYNRRRYDVPNYGYPVY